MAYLKAAVSDDGPSAIELSHDDTPVLKDLGNSLFVAYVVDTGNAFSYVQYRDMAEESVTAAQLHRTALDNLSKIASSGNLRVAPHGNIFAVLLDGNFESSMILLYQFWDESFRQFVQGDYLAAFPTRDVLAFCDASSDTGRKELLELIVRLKHSQDHPLTQDLYVRRGNGWLPENAA